MSVVLVVTQVEVVVLGVTDGDESGDEVDKCCILLLGWSPWIGGGGLTHGTLALNEVTVGVPGEWALVLSLWSGSPISVISKGRADSHNILRHILTCIV